MLSFQEKITLHRNHYHFVCRTLTIARLVCVKAWARDCRAVSIGRDAYINKLDCDIIEACDIYDQSQ